MTWRCVAFFSKQCVCIFVKYLQDGFIIIQTHAMTWRCVAFFSKQCVCIEVKYLQDGFTILQTHAMTWRCVAFFFKAMRLYFCRIFARWVYNNTNARNEWHDDALLFFGWMRLYLCRIFARFTIIQTHAMTWRCVAFFSKQCVCIEVKYLQDGFTIIQTHAMTRRIDDALPFFKAMRLYRGKIFARWVYNNSNARDDPCSKNCAISRPAT